MKTMVLSGVFGLASAGLALASAGVSDGAATKPAAATLVSVAPAAPEASLAPKKGEPAAPVTQTTADCSATPGLPLCADLETKT